MKLLLTSLLTVLSILTVAVSSSAAGRGNYQQRWLKSSGNAELQLNYSYLTTYYNSNKPARTDYASPLDVTVRLTDSRRDSQVRVVLTTYGESTETCGQSKSYDKKEFVMDLKYDQGAGVYRGSFENDAMTYAVVNGQKVLVKADTKSQPGVIIKYWGYCNTMPYWLDLSFVIDDAWQVDPLNGTTHFYPRL